MPAGLQIRGEADDPVRADRLWALTQTPAVIAIDALVEVAGRAGVEKLAAKLEKVTERLEADAPSVSWPGADLDRALPGPWPDCQVSWRHDAVLVTPRLFVLDGRGVWAYGRWRTPGAKGDPVYPGTHARERADQAAFVMASTGQSVSYAEYEA
ncbi:MAG TPA: hypothetical protein VE979_26080, partial [Streptosporangiaceae bacterium]|nr:hypothetical protein [Streptosporangiaceae bacterium]